MKIQVYTLDANDITWSKDGTLGTYSGHWDVQNMDSKRSMLRLDRFLNENSDKIGDKGWLLGLSSVFYVPFIRFGDEIVVEKPKKKEKTGENKRIQGENPSETPD